MGRGLDLSYTARIQILSVITVRRENCIILVRKSKVYVIFVELLVAGCCFISLTISSTSPVVLGNQP